MWVFGCQLHGQQIEQVSFFVDPGFCNLALQAFGVLLETSFVCTPAASNAGGPRGR